MYLFQHNRSIPRVHTPKYRHDTKEPGVEQEASTFIQPMHFQNDEEAGTYIGVLVYEGDSLLFI